MTNKFLKNNFPSIVNRFRFYSNDGVNYKSDLGVFIHDLLPSLNHVKDYFRIEYCYLSKEYLKSLLKYSSHLDTLYIRQCYTDTQTYDFEHIDYGLKNLYLSGVGCSSLANWKQNPKKFENLIKGLSNTSLRKSLKQISIVECQLEIASAKKIMELYGMGHINLTENTYNF